MIRQLRLFLLILPFAATAACSQNEASPTPASEGASMSASSPAVGPTDEEASSSRGAHSGQSAKAFAVNVENLQQSGVNNAAAFYPTPLPDVSAEQFNELININLRAPYFLTKTFVDYLKGGSVVNIIDIYAEKPLRGFSAYSISKAGLAMMTRSLADELGPDIRVNGIAPGAILWPDATVMDNKTIEGILAGIPAGRLGDPNDIANAALFLVDQADYVSGQIISVAGGSSV